MRAMGDTNVDIAAVNGPLLVVLLGKSGSVDALVMKLTEGEVKSKALNTSHAFHSSLMEPMLADFKKDRRHRGVWGAIHSNGRKRLLEVP